MLRLGPYYLLDLLGSGSTAKVYRAQDSRQGRTVALKVLRRGAPEAFFQRELEASRRLQHDAIVRVEALENLDGQLALVTPYLEGKTLDKLLLPVVPTRALKLVRQLAVALAHAHNRGVVHGDLKPANLLLVDEQVKILDFGLAQFDDSDDLAPGTLEYRAPEVARGQAASPQSDLWALGVILYELLTGISPFRADSIMLTLKNISGHHQAAASSLRHDLPPRLDAVLQRLLIKQPAERYQTADELISDLRSDLTESSPGVELAPNDNAADPALPLSAAQLIGRDEERAVIALYLQDPDCRLLSLHGMGGIGKTSLAHAALADQQAAGQNCHFVSLVTAQTLLPELVQALAADKSLPPLEALRLRLSISDLLVLDNLEHLKDQTAVLETLLARCPRLKLLVTSRERLGLSSEWVLPLAGLSYPHEADDVASEFAATELLVRASRGRLDPEQDAAALLKICQQLKGHPLALQLVAGWLKHCRLEEALARLTSGALTSELTPLFQQSLTLLSQRQVTLFGQTGLFETSFSLAAARQVLNCQEDELDVLLDAALLDRNVDGRYHQHPLTLAFARARLADQLDETLQSRFCQYYLQALRDWDRKLLAGEQRKVLAYLEHDYRNVEAALTLNPVQLSADEAEPLRVFYTQTGRYSEGESLFAGLSSPHTAACHAWFVLLKGDASEAAQLAPGLEPAEARTALLITNLRAGIAWQQGDATESEGLTLTALELATALGDIPSLTALRSNLGLLSETLGHPGAAAEHYQASLALAEKSGNEGMTVLNLNNLAALYVAEARFDKARPLLEKGLVLSSKSRLERLKPLLQSNLGLCLYAAGDLDNAAQAYKEAAAALLQRGQTGAAATVEGYLAQVYRAKGDSFEAQKLLQAALKKAKAAADEQSCLSIIVRFAELLAPSDPVRASKLAGLVATHPLSDAGDRSLARQFTAGATASDLDETIATLLT